MSKRAKILIALIIISLGLVLYLILQSKIITIKPQDNAPDMSRNKTTKIDLAQMEAKYRSDIKTIVSDYDRFLSQVAAGGSATTTSLDKTQAKQEVTALKNRLYELIVPPKLSAEAKQLQIEYLLYSMNLIDSYLSSDDQKDLSEALAVSDKIKTDFPWAVN